MNMQTEVEKLRRMIKDSIAKMETLHDFTDEERKQHELNLIEAKALLRGIEQGQVRAQKNRKKLENLLARKPLPPKA